MRDIIETQKLLKSGGVKAKRNRIFEDAIRNATLVFSSATNFCELKKHRSNSRMDAAQALVLALGQAARWADIPKVAFEVAVA